jgi:hypothetical protein
LASRLQNAPSPKGVEEMVMSMRIFRAGVLVAVLLAGPASAREIVPTSWAELIRGLIPSVVNITVRIAGTAATEETLVSAGQSASPYRIAVGSGFVIDSSGLTPRTGTWCRMLSKSS